MRPRGASAVFGPQKGASAEQVAQLDAALAHFAKVVAATLGEDFSRVPGVGAAGSLGFAAGHSSARVSAQASNWWRSWPGWPMRWSVPTWC